MLMSEIEIPHYFLCPISIQIMKDPVTISTGITYERENIEKWMFTARKSTCPVTKQILSDPELTPNITLRRLIQAWCTSNADHGVERLMTPRSPVGTTEILKILMDADSPQMQLKSLMKLKTISLSNQSSRKSMEAVGVFEFLVSVISRPESIRGRDEALSILSTLQLSESALKSLNNEDFVMSLTLAMQKGSFESRAYSVMLLKQMMEQADPSLFFSLRPQFFAELARILKDQMPQSASKSALRVLISACPWGSNRIKAVKSGTVSTLIHLLLDSPEKRACEMILTALDLLCQCAEGRAEILSHGAGLAVVSKKILRVSHVASERAVRILHSVSRFCATPGVLQEMLQIGVVAKLCLVLQVDSGARTRERSREILKLHSREWGNSSCIPQNFVLAYTEAPVSQRQRH